MKIKTINKTYDEVMALPKPKRKKPLKPLLFWRCLVWLLSLPAILKARFTYTGEMPKGPCMILMNHSCFMDMKIAYRILFPRPFCIVSTSDGMIGKRWLMRQIGCIPTQKFVNDLGLLTDMRYALKKGASVLMYPEASYSFDGTAHPIPKRMGVILKKLDVPVVMIRTYGAFTRDPLYNELQLRRVPISATVECLLTREQLAERSVEDIDLILENAFTFDHFAWQRDNGIVVKESFRADGLERILYRCPHCQTEGKTVGKGTTLTCTNCGKVYELDELGRLAATDGDTRFDHIPDWYNWQRELVREQLQAGEYCLDVPVDIAMQVDFKAIYRIGGGRLVHNADGFTLTGEDGRVYFQQPPHSSFSVNTDYFWYELGDIVGFGDKNAMFFCFPPSDVPVAKVRLAAEELYKLTKKPRRERNRTPIPAE